MTLTLGSQGDDVKALQNQLIALGYKITADGIYGNQTATAVSDFQALNHLLQDGTAGPVTLAQINSELGNKSIYGIDVSAANGIINWDEVKASGKVQFAIIKCTEGGTYLDPRFKSNLSELQRVGITYGAYHFFRFFTSAPLDEAANLKAAANPVYFGKNTLPIIVDVEYQDVKGYTNSQVSANAAQCAANLKIFIDQVTQDFKRAPMIYTNADFWNNVLKSPKGFENLALWIADYRPSSGPALPRGWNDYKIWQYSSTAQISGINGPVDLDVLKGSLSDLTSLS